MNNLLKSCNTYYNLVLNAGIARSKKKRGLVCITAEDKRNSSNLDKFPINSISEVKRALKHANEMTKPPKWWNGSVDELKLVIIDTIKQHYNIETKDNKTIVTSKVTKA